MRIFNRTLIFDFGSSNTVVCDENGEVIFDEGTVIVYYADGYVEIGERAYILREGEREWLKPIVNGYVNNYDAFEDYVKRLVKKLVLFPRLCLKTVVVAIPNDLTENECASECGSAFIAPFRKVGIKDIRIIHRSLAVYLGSKSMD